MLPLDLHVLSLSLAFILSQDQTLHCTFFLFIRSSLNSSFIVVIELRIEFWELKQPSLQSLLTVVFFTLYLYYIFVVFNLSKNLFPFLSKRTAKLRHFFELTKYFKKNIYFFFSIICSLTRRQPLSIADAKLLLFLKLPKYFYLFLCFFYKSLFIKKIFFVFLWVKCYFKGFL